MGEISKLLAKVGEISKCDGMVGEISKDSTRSPLLPDRHPQGDFFVCDIFDAAPRGDMAAMEHPVFSLSTKPDVRPRRYERGERWLEVAPSVKGLATVHDRDVLIYCISQVMAALNQGRKVSRTVRFKAFDLLTATNRQTNGQAYDGLKAAFERLRGTTISTNIITGGIEQTDIFGLIDHARIIRETREGRMLDVEIVLSDWVFNAIESNEVLTLNRRYFQLRKPLERRLYELARKHCGRQREWKIGLEGLREKVGSNSTVKEFRRLVRKIIADDMEHDHMPDYRLRLDADIITVTPKPEFIAVYAEDDQTPVLLLDGDTLDAAKSLVPGWDIYHVKREWEEWMTELPRNPDAAFLGFCKKWFARHGVPS